MGRSAARKGKEAGGQMGRRAGGSGAVEQQGRRQEAHGQEVRGRRAGVRLARWQEPGSPWAGGPGQKGWSQGQDGMSQGGRGRGQVGE